jgi:hypothetical protein
MEFLRVHLQRGTPPRLCDPPCSEKQAGIGPTSQKPELVTAGLNDALYCTSFPPRGGEQSIISWSPPHGRVRPSFSGQRTVFLSGANFSRLFFIF